MTLLSLKHDDKELNLLRILAMGAVGVYLFRTFKKEGNLSRTIANPAATQFKTKQMLEMAGTVAESYLPDTAKPIFQKLKNPIMNLATMKINNIIGQENNVEEDE
jgi:hypothetical protein